MHHLKYRGDPLCSELCTHHDETVYGDGVEHHGEIRHGDSVKHHDEVRHGMVLYTMVRSGTMVKLDISLILMSSAYLAVDG